MIDLNEYEEITTKEYVNLPNSENIIKVLDFNTYKTYYFKKKEEKRGKDE